MKPPSRSMPSRTVPKPAGFAGWTFLAVLVTFLVWGLYASVAVRWGAVGILALFLVAIATGARWQSRMTKDRFGESICTFARTLPARRHDTWVVRAVYEEISDNFNFPIRTTDNLLKDLRFDPDELDDTVFEAARRSGRSMEDVQRNPMFDRVTTVADLIVFLEHQPRG